MTAAWGWAADWWQPPGSQPEIRNQNRWPFEISCFDRKLQVTRFRPVGYSSLIYSNIFLGILFYATLLPLHRIEWAIEGLDTLPSEVGYLIHFLCDIIEATRSKVFDIYWVSFSFLYEDTWSRSSLMKRNKTSIPWLSSWPLPARGWARQASVRVSVSFFSRGGRWYSDRSGWDWVVCGFSPTFYSSLDSSSFFFHVQVQKGFAVFAAT